MSTSNRIVYGYGFPASGISDEKLRRFILAHANTILDNHEDYAERLVEIAEHDHFSSLEETFPDVRCEESLQEGALAVVSNTMSEESGVRFEYRTGDDAGGNGPVILLTSSLPLCFRETGRLPGMDTADRIMSTYMEELGIPGIPGEMFDEVA